ncbi:hypothetical protein HanRHA438_Chr12g0571591 [Helianthus annuus]|nr:hypothetical protein HanRHA438_Chr12g0571591 [Helianthus annuus]
MMMMIKHTPQLQVRRRIRVYNYVLQGMINVCPAGMLHKLSRCEKTAVTNAHYFHFFTFPVFVKNPVDSSATWPVSLREDAWHVD